ncbi:MAG: protein jag [Spirochaetaceae bacterium]|nr:protein jag [Spirochaetaceae bacterium]
MIYEFEGKTEKEAIELASEELGLSSEQFDVEILESQTPGIFKKGFVKIKVTIPDGVDGSQNNDEPVIKTITANPCPQDDFEKALLDFLENLIVKMGYSAKFEVMFREGRKLGLRFTSEYSSILIGKKGKNLDSIQLLANVFAGNHGREDLKIIVDSENYRIRREEALVRLAYSGATKVQSTKKSILLEPMNPYERRIIHTTLSDIADITTESEGDGLYKQVRIKVKGGR